MKIRLRSALARASLMTAGLITALLGVEVILRLAGPGAPWIERAADFQSLYLRLDERIGVLRRPDVDLYFRFDERPSGWIHFQSNNLGLRRSTPLSPHKEGARRLLVLGDSHIDGAVDNPENLTRLLEEGLSAQGQAWEVLNAAVGSYSPYQSLLWYQQRGKSLSPDVVVLTFYLGNDLAELATPGRPRLIAEQGRYRSIPPTAELWESMGLDFEEGFRFHLWLLNSSRSYGFMVSRLAPQDAPGPQDSASALCLGCTGQSLAQLAWIKEKEDYDDNLEIFAEVVRRLSSEAVSQDARPILMLLPSRLRVEPKRDRSRILKAAQALGLQEKDFALEERLRQDLIRIGHGRGVTVLDLFPPLAAAARDGSGPLFYSTDWHLNARGHQIAASALLELMAALR